MRTNTTAQANAARRNGTHSNGPASATGKSTSSQNARKHNFFTNTALLPSEDQAVFACLIEDFTAEHQPNTPTEQRYVREMADAEFRLQRVRYYASQNQWKTMQTLTDSETPDADAFEILAEQSKSLHLALRYERHFQRQFDSALKILLDLKKRSATNRRAEAEDRGNAALKALEELILAPTPGELYGYGEDIEEPGEPENTPQQNEPGKRPITH